MCFSLGVLLLKGHYFSNNSIVNINDIGEDGEALYCFTNESQCCRSQDNFIEGISNWYSPDGNPVGNKMANTISRTRGPRSVILHRDNVLAPTGIYRCQIYDESTYVGVYSDSKGSNKLLLFCVLFSLYRLKSKLSTVNLTV